MAVSVYSDDHGQTWKPGAPTEGSADENKVVELSDGRLLLNSRTQGTAGQRLEAISYDGGQTWGPFRHNWDLTDPRNNASIIRAFPGTPNSSARAPPPCPWGGLFSFCGRFSCPAQLVQYLPGLLSLPPGVSMSRWSRPHGCIVLLCTQAFHWGQP